MIIQVAKDDVILFARDRSACRGRFGAASGGATGCGHVGILFGATEWQSPAAPKPVRLDRDFRPVHAVDQHYQDYADVGERDLETIGIGFLEELRPLVAQLHHKLEFWRGRSVAGSDYCGIWAARLRARSVAVGIPDLSRASGRARRILANAGLAAAVHATLSARRRQEGAAYSCRGALSRGVGERCWRGQHKDQRAYDDPPLIALIEGADPRIAKLGSQQSEIYERSAGH